MNENEDDNLYVGRICSHGSEYFSNKISTLEQNNNQLTISTNQYFNNINKFYHDSNYNSFHKFDLHKQSKPKEPLIKIGLTKFRQKNKTKKIKKKYITLETDNDNSLNTIKNHINVLSLPMIVINQTKVAKSANIKNTRNNHNKCLNKTNTIESQTQAKFYSTNKPKLKLIQSSEFNPLLTTFISKQLKVSGAFVPQNSSLSSKLFKQPLKYFEPSMISTIGSTTSIIRAFASNSYKGLYTEENYSNNLLVLNVAPPSYAKISKDFFWPSCSIFGIYDGHNGKKCSEYLRENLHQNILRSEHFPKRMENAITSGFELTDRNFIREKGLSIGRDILKDKSGSSALLAIFVNNYLHIASLGDSVALISYNYLSSYKVVSRSHVFSNESERHRVEVAGGKFRTLRASAKGYSKYLSLPCYEVVVPGKIPTTRSIGDVEAKVKRFGGVENVILPTPEVTTVKITDEMDFLFIGNNSIFQTMTHNDILQCVRIALNEEDCFDEDKMEINNHKVCGKAVDLIIKTAQARNAIGSLSGLLIFLREFDELLDDSMNNNKDCDNVLQMKK